MTEVEHGTPAGWNLHMIQGSEPCWDCARAQNTHLWRLRQIDYLTELQKRTRHWPVELRPEHADLGLPGAQVAQGIRENA